MERLGSWWRSCTAVTSISWSRAALDRDADLLDSRKWGQLGDPDAGPWRAKLTADNFRDGFGEALHQLVRVIRGEYLQPLDDRGVVKSILEAVAAEHARRRQVELEIDQQRLCQVLLPLLDADARLDAQIGDKDSVHGRRKTSGFGTENKVRGSLPRTVGALCYNPSRPIATHCR